MNCPVCGKRTRVMESRLKEPGVTRRRKCKQGHLSYTLEGFVAGPQPKLKKPEVVKIKKPKKPKPSKPKLKSIPKPAPYGPALKEWGLVVTKDSPLWLRSIAMKLERF